MFFKSLVLAVALLAALTHVDATEVQGQLKGETQLAEQAAVEAKAGQSLRAGLLGSLSQTDSASTQGSNCNCNMFVFGRSYYYEGAYNRCTCDQGCTCTNCNPPSGDLTGYTKSGVYFVSAGHDFGSCSCKHGGMSFCK